MPVPTATSGDAIQAIINVSIAQSHRLILSWLPPPTPEETALQKTEDQLAKEDAELFIPMPPRLGLGAPIPKDFLESADTKAHRQAVFANEALKRKIMGRGKSSSNQEASKPRPRTANDQLNANSDDEEEEEEEEGRSSLGKPKRRKLVIDKKEERKEDASDHSTKKEKERRAKGADEKATKVSTPSSSEETAKIPPKGPVRFGTYLDLHKAGKAKKKKKKKKLAIAN